MNTKSSHELLLPHIMLWECEFILFMEKIDIVLLDYHCISNTFKISVAFKNKHLFLTYMLLGQQGWLCSILKFLLVQKGNLRTQAQHRE